MKQTHFLKRILAVSLGMIFMQSCLMAQSFKLELDKPKVEKLESPNLGANTGNKNYKPKDWMEIELKMKIISADKKVKFADKVTVKWYIAVKSPEGGRKFILMEKEIDHVNVPVDEDIYTSVYLSPSALTRLTGSDRVSKGDIEEVGGEIQVNGMAPAKNSGFFSLKTQGKWWNSGSLSRYDKIPLRNKDETPFKNFWYDRYAEIDVKR